MRSLPSDDALYGEYALVDAMQFVRDVPKRLERYQRATALIPGRSLVLPQNAFFLLTYNNPLITCLGTPGRADTTVADLYSCAKLHRCLRSRRVACQP
ncbi:MAG: hypothetical protein VB027_06555 [Gordonibacter sp.]|nr:hypothetical protein [Gordonibacter sp.]